MAKQYKTPKLRIRKALDEHGISGYELAKRLGKSGHQITRMFKPDYNPKWSSLVEIANAIDCPVSDLYEQKEN